MNFSATQAKPFRVSHMGGRQGKTSAGKDERNRRILQHTYSILTPNHSNGLQICTGFSPIRGLLFHQLCIGNDCLTLLFDGQFHISSAAQRNAFRQFVEILATAHSTIFSQEVPTIQGWILPNGI